MNMPGFTANNTLYVTRGNYRALTDAPNVPVAAAVMLALARETTVDCHSIPDATTCHECNSNGPGTLDCCRLRDHGDSCIIVNDPNAEAQFMEVPPTRWFPTATIRNLLRNSFVRGL